MKSKNNDELIKAAKIFKKLKINLNDFDLKQVSKGILVEHEHNDVTKGKFETILKIVIAHLKEMPDYYSKLEKMEGKTKKKKKTAKTVKKKIVVKKKKVVK